MGDTPDRLYYEYIQNIGYTYAGFYVRFIERLHEREVEHLCVACRNSTPSNVAKSRLTQIELFDKRDMTKYQTIGVVPKKHSTVEV